MRREIKIALFTIVILVSMYLVVNHLKGKELFGINHTYYTEYYQIDGLVPTTPVYLRGLKIGNVEKIEYKSERDLFIVALRLKSNYQIPVNSKAIYYDSDIMGSKAIKIELGDSKEILKSKGVLESSVEEGIFDAIGSSLLPLADQLGQLTNSLDTLLFNLNSTLDPQTRDNIKESIEELSIGIKGGRQLIEEFKGFTPNIDRTLSNIESITEKLEGGSEALSKTIENFSQISDSLVTADLAGAVNSLKSLLQKIESPDGTIGKIIAEDALHESTISLISEIEDLIAKIKENPRKFIKISVF